MRQVEYCNDALNSALADAPCDEKYANGGKKSLCLFYRKREGHNQTADVAEKICVRNSPKEEWIIT
ncbi:hypothetical protein SUBVAR_05564 [Subdoligranulum variabile DSM 15176]|uniref:Uncharacterized protein n=1 Tax=Subdoligranulum variabile DSM 15176 TaxID=411471 RepID=D1PMK3_9FIRM|nr:hypothetical protein SUBVAR_05564 [Subdoligranulum variabile DSM 15176]